MESVEVRLARLEGSYEQIDRRLGSIEDRLGRVEVKLDEVAGRLDGKIDTTATNLDRKIEALSGRVHALLYGIAVAILVPILIRVFFP